MQRAWRYEGSPAMGDDIHVGQIAGFTLRVNWSVLVALDPRGFGPTRSGRPTRKLHVRNSAPTVEPVEALTRMKQRCHLLGTVVA